MRYIRTLQRKAVWFWLFALAIGLRSLIAPGFMLNTGGDGPFGLSITFCGGLNGADNIPAVHDPHAAHHGAGDHAVDQSHETGHGLVNAGCGLWSASATFVQNIEFTSDHLLLSGPDQFQIDYQSPSLRAFHGLRLQARAPPVASII
jgi:hypothetical protein